MPLAEAHLVDILFRAFRVRVGIADHAVVADFARLENAFINLILQELPCRSWCHVGFFDKIVRCEFVIANLRRD